LSCTPSACFGPRNQRMFSSRPLHLFYPAVSIHVVGAPSRPARMRTIFGGSHLRCVSDMSERSSGERVRPSIQGRGVCVPQTWNFGLCRNGNSCPGCDSILCSKPTAQLLVGRLSDLGLEGSSFIL